MKIKKNFMKDVPVEKQGVVMKKLKTFASILPNKRTLSDIPKGFWVRNVAGTDIYKFRVNSGDRILFKYEQIDGQESIIFLSFQNHDNQIRAAKSVSKNIEIEEFSINQDTYVEDAIDAEIDSYVKTEIYHQLEAIKQDAVFEDEYINLIIEEDEKEVHILSMEQFECLKEVLQPVIVFGCAGSGKTSITVRKLMMNHSLYGNSVYLTKSPMIIEKTKDMFPENAINTIDFYTLKELLLKEVNLQQATIIEFEDFEKWMQNEQQLPQDGSLSTRDVWLEINTILKGTISIEGRMLSKESYFSSEESSYELVCRKIIYQISRKYELWLKVNEYYDYNDLVYLALQKESLLTYNNIVFDEIQELTNKQLFYLLKITKNKQNLLMLGDIHQVTEHYSFNLQYLKQQLYEENFTLREYFIYKNYRSGEKTVQLINGLKEIKFDLFSHEGESFRIHDVPVRNGNKPILIHEEFDVYKVFSQLEQNVDTIVIVSDNPQKQQLLDMGLKRIFTIEETRGLEYKKVYGYNLLTSFKDLWNHLLNQKQKVNDLYRAYFNLVYLAVTRSKESLYFIESEKTILEKKLSPFFNQSQKLQSIIAENVQESSTDGWLSEANKLFKLRKYEKAADAYDKAGQFEERDLCLKLAHHKVLYDYSEEYRSFIQLSTQNCSPQILRIMLDFIERKYASNIFGAVQLNVEVLPKFGGNHKRLKGFLEPEWSNTEKATYLYELMSQSIFDRTEMTFIVTLFMDGEPVTLKSLSKTEHQDIHVQILENKIKIYTTTLHQQRELENFYDLFEKEHNKQLPNVQGDYGFQFIEENKEKYKNATAESILNSIFGRNS